MTNFTLGYDIWVIEDNIREMFVTITCCIVNASIALFGIIFNTLNVVVFIKMGFQETTNISLMGLTISDLGCLLTLEWIYLCFNPLFSNAGLPFVSFEIEYITGGWPHVCFARITAFITAFVTFERCLCIVRPLEVKRILTPARTFYIIVGIYVLMFVSVSPAFGVNLLQWKFYSSENKTRIGIVYTENRNEVERVLFATNNSCGYIAFLMVSLFTAVLISRLKLKGRWRQESVAADLAGSALSRDRKVMKMVLTISAVFIVFSFPITIVFIGTMAYPQFGTGGKYANLFYMCAQSAYLMEIINSSVNFFIYYLMSAKFRKTVSGWYRDIVKIKK
ncbi:growth hormone secretagogue receptor type 1 [Biomphalaria glabrata]|nr:allatostatin-A receptor-like [Biomphalaria glabrata]